MLSSINPERIAPLTAPIAPKIDITITAVVKMRRRKRWIGREAPAEKMKKTRFIPCAASCGVSVKSERYITIRPPLPTPSPESIEITNAANAVKIAIFTSP